ncbi:MAG: hypothetical protein EPN22_12920 [Nitrospirae bacterium]|nr:MAG: hypothetical protein EPN22_12920 [Nitrospirota bacterium]
MATALESKLSDLIHEIKEIKKELIFQEIAKTRVAKKRLTTWRSLGKRISGKWDEMSVADEIAYQREKTW